MIKKIGFFGVFRYELKRFGIWLYDLDDAQTYKKGAQLYTKKVVQR